MPILLPLCFIASQVAALPHGSAAHHPYARPHRLHTHGPGPKLVVPSPPPAQKSAPAPTQDDGIEAIEQVESVTPTDVGAAAGDNKDSGANSDHVFGVAPDASASLATAAGAAGALGHLHAAFVHLPIAWVLLWATVELLSLLRSASGLHTGAVWLGLLTTLSYGPSVVSGLCRLDELASATKGYDTAEALLHRNLIFVAAGLCGFCLLLRLINWRWPNMFCRLLCLMGVVAAAAVTSWSAHLGGRMVYGADFLPF